MATRFSRRQMMQGASGVVLAQSLAEAAVAASAPRRWPIEEGPNTPKICLSAGDGGRPLPAPPQPPGREAAGPGGPGPGRGPGQGRGRMMGQYGGFLAPSAQPAPPAPAPESGRRPGFFGDPSAGYQRIRQLGVSHLIYVGIGGTPWTVEAVTRAVQSAKEHGLVAYHAMINIPNSIIYGREDRGKDMESVIASIEAAGKGGMPIVEYNFYAHRVIEGYYETVGRARAGYTAFDYELELLVDENNLVVQPIYRDENGRITPETLAAFPNARKVKVKDLPALPREGARTLEEMWANITWFLKAAVPAAEKAGVKLALHPNDPPAPISRGSQQIMGSLAGWKRLISIVNSPANGITYDCGVTREMGEDPVAVAEYFGSRKRINHVHYRNVIVEKPYEKYQEVFVDNGMVDMFGVMRALVRNGYNHMIYPEHQRALDYDRERAPGGRLPGYPGGGGYTGLAYNVAYTRAMLQAALASL
ncbi:MAG: mannonate dehydratase [Bryobacterales bacterium]|nr:mannonate dehydratase [Bryobacterales bacterium]